MCVLCVIRMRVTSGMSNGSTSHTTEHEEPSDEWNHEIWPGQSIPYKSFWGNSMPQNEDPRTPPSG